MQVLQVRVIKINQFSSTRINNETLVTISQLINKNIGNRGEDVMILQVQTTVVETTLPQSNVSTNCWIHIPDFNYDKP